MKNKHQLILEIGDQKYDWFKMSRKLRRQLEAKAPKLVAQIKAVAAEMMKDKKTEVQDEA